MDDLLRRLAQEAQKAQHEAKLRREAGSARMLRQARADEVAPTARADESVRFINKKERMQMLKRKVAYLLAILFLAALLIAQIVQASGEVSGGLGVSLVM